MLRIVADPLMLDALIEAIPDAHLDDPEDGDELNLDIGASASVAFDAFLRASRGLWLKLMPFITARPEMEIEFEGPGGKIKLKLKNVSEQSLRDAANKVMAVGRGAAE